MENTNVCYKAKDTIAKCWTSASVTGEIVAQSPIYTIPEKYLVRYPEYEFYRVAAKRKSGAADYIICAISDKAIKENLKLGSIVRLSGDIRRLEFYQNTEKKWVMVLFADKKAEILERSTEAQDSNRVSLEGYFMKTTPARGTTTDKRLADMFIILQEAVQDNGYVPSVVIPCLVWGNVMDDVKENLMVGDKVRVIGRFQSRAYKKTETSKFSDQYGEELVFEAQEISATRVTKVLPLECDLEAAQEEDADVRGF